MKTKKMWNNDAVIKIKIDDALTPLETAFPNLGIERFDGGMNLIRNAIYEELFSQIQAHKQNME